jgi:hypothetical protein
MSAEFLPGGEILVDGDEALAFLDLFDAIEAKNEARAAAAAQEPAAAIPSH